MGGMATMKTMKECEKLTNPKLLVEIRNRNTILKCMNTPAGAEELRHEIKQLWKLMERNK